MSARNCTLSLLGILLLASTSAAAEIRGMVIKADQDKKQLTIEARGKGVRGMVMTFQINKDTQILAGKQTAQLPDLAAGRRVRVVYDDRDGQHLAVLVTLPGVLTPATPVAAAPRDANTVSGSLRRVAQTDREIVVVSSGARGEAETETTLGVPDNVKITRDQKSIRFEDLREGDSVIVRTEKKAGKLQALSIDVGAPGQLASNPSGERKGEKLRQILKMIDAFLQTMDKR